MVTGICDPKQITRTIVSKVETCLEGEVCQLIFYVRFKFFLKRVFETDIGDKASTLKSV